MATRTTAKCTPEAWGIARLNHSIFLVFFMGEDSRTLVDLPTSSRSGPVAASIGGATGCRRRRGMIVSRGARRRSLILRRPGEAVSASRRSRAGLPGSQPPSSCLLGQSAGLRRQRRTDTQFSNARAASKRVGLPARSHDFGSWPAHLRSMRL